MRRVLCVWFPRLATECLSPPERRGVGTAAVVTVVNEGTKVEAVSEAAEAAGVKPGMGWADARARCPSLRRSPPDREGEARAMRTAARIAERYGPWVVRGMDEILVDVAGTAHLFGGEPAMLEDCRRRFAKHGWSVRVAVADGVGAARGLARFACPSPAVGSPEAVYQLPVEALRLDNESVVKLRRVGLRQVGDLANRPRAALAERFGEPLVRGLEQLLGDGSASSEPLGACPPRPELRMSWEGVEPLLVPRSVEAVCTRLLERLCDRLRQGDLGARKMILELGFDEPRAEPRRVEVRAGRGLRAAERWLALFRERREAFDPGSGVIRLRLAAAVVEPFDPVVGSDPEELWERLAARLGARNVVRFRPASRFRPEVAFESEPVLVRTPRRGRASAPEPERPTASSATVGAGRFDGMPAVSSPSPGPRCGTGGCELPPQGLDALGVAEADEEFGLDGPGPDGPGWAPGRAMNGGENPRPLRLLAFPEPVGVERETDDPLQPPAVLRRRGGRPVRLRRARGPERIALEWWGDGEAESENEGSLAGRDYWQVETERGVRLWLYREVHPGGAVRWFLHGFFP